MILENIMEIKEVSKHVVIGRTVEEDSIDTNCAAIIMKDFIVVVDALMFPQHANIFREHVELTYKKKVKYLVLTHYHADHTFGMAAYTDCDIIASSDLAAIVKEKIDTVWTKQAIEDEAAHQDDEKLQARWLSVKLRTPNILFSDIYTIDDEDLTIKIIHSGGHTKGSSYLWIENEKVIIAGDLVFTQRWPWAGDPGCNPDTWYTIFETLKGFTPQFIVPGHGEVCLKEELDFQMQKFKMMKSAVQKAINDKKEAIEVDTSFLEQDSSDWVVSKSVEHWMKHYS